ncbi:MAG: hypothetical protein JWL69_905, partial [Phycisphaerales bacterium]|nr:hypothetical protein [Phycisphaerales bacterium]
YEVREFVRREHGWRRVAREEVLISPGHYEDRHSQVVVTPGHYEDVQREEVGAGHFEEGPARQELVAPGHWETRVDRVVVVPGHYDGETIARIDIGGHRR